MNNIKRNNLTLQKKINYLENKIKSIQLILNRKDEERRKYKKMSIDANSDLKTSETMNEILKINAQYSKLKIKQLEDKVVEVRNTRDDVHYFEFYDSLISDLKELFYWPLAMVDLTKPHILPSGNTINEDTLDELIRRGSFDPYNKNFIVQQRIVNRFASHVQEIIKLNISIENDVHINLIMSIEVI